MKLQAILKRNLLFAKKCDRHHLKYISSRTNHIPAFLHPRLNKGKLTVHLSITIIQYYTLVWKISYIYYTKNAKAVYSVGMFKPTTFVDKRFNSICKNKKQKKTQFIYFIWRKQLIKDTKNSKYFG